MSTKYIPLEYTEFYRSVSFSNESVSPVLLCIAWLVDIL
jgi:hypothetical protein